MATHSKYITPLKGKKPQLADVLSFVQDHHQKTAEEVGISKTLLELGVTDKVSSQWQSIIDNPIENMHAIKKNIDTTFVGISNTIVSSFLSSHKEIISKVFMIGCDSNDMHYGIVLKRDNLTNRDLILKFFDHYNKLDWAHSYPVYFQFIPAKLISKITRKIELPISNQP